MKKTHVDQERLTRLWKTYINDPSLFTKESFGRYLHTRIMKSGWCWPALYYAKAGEEYTMVFKHIHNNNEDGIRRVL